MTLGVDFYVKSVKIPESETSVELYLFDTSGNNIYQHIRTNYWDGSSMLMVVYDMTNRASFLNVAKWIEETKPYVRQQSKLQGVLVASKLDLKDHAVVSVEEATELANLHNLAFFECSALSGKDVDAPFNFLANSFHLMYEEKLKQLEERIE